jgi:hypothetical protein
MTKAIVALTIVVASGFAGWHVYSDRAEDIAHCETVTRLASTKTGVENPNIMKALADDCASRGRLTRN